MNASSIHVWEYHQESAAPSLQKQANAVIEEGQQRFCVSSTMLYSNWGDRVVLQLIVPTTLPGISPPHPTLFYSSPGKGF